MATYTKAPLSESTDGRGIKVVQTGTAGTKIHEGSSTATDIDEVTIYAYNGHTADVVLTIEYGGVTVPDDTIVQTIPFKQGLFLVVPALIIKGNATPLSVRAFAGSANVITIHGHRIRRSE